MPFGAHESLETHEILNDNICMLDHFAFYTTQCEDERLRNLVQNHMQRVAQGYNQMVTYTHSYQIQPNQMQPGMGHSMMQNISPDQIQYGLRSPQQAAPQMQMGTRYFNDQQIAVGVLHAHKNSSKCHMIAALECADPNVRQMMMNGAIECCNMAYETFLYMNQRGMYQVPTMDSHTAKTMLHTYQPIAMNQMHGGMQTPGMTGQGAKQSTMSDDLNRQFQNIGNYQ